MMASRSPLEVLMIRLAQEYLNIQHERLLSSAWANDAATSLDVLKAAGHTRRIR